MYRGRLIPGDFSPNQLISPETGNQNPHPALSHKKASDRAEHESGPENRPSLPHRRIACLLVADFSVAAIARGNPELKEQPFALVRMAASRQLAGNSSGFSRKSAEYQSHSELSNVSPAARASGLRPGMTVAQARALIPDLIVTHPSPAAERSAADALLDVAESMSPVIEEGVPGCVWIDLTGMETLYRISGRADSADGLASGSPDSSAEQREN